jgi:hypothetical protein
MPYRTGEIPMVGDHVKKLGTGRLGTVTDAQLNSSSHGGRDQVSVNWDDGGLSVAVSVADEYELVKRGKGKR